MGRTDELVSRLTGEPGAGDALAHVARELRRRHQDRHERQRRQVAARMTGYSPRRGVRRVPGARTLGAQR